MSCARNISASEQVAKGIVLLSTFKLPTNSRWQRSRKAEASFEVGDVVEPHRVANIRDLFVSGIEQLARMRY